MTTPHLSTWRDGLGMRERQEVELAEHYATHLRHGTDGHSRLMLIARLAALLDCATAPAEERPAPAIEEPPAPALPRTWEQEG